MAVAYDQMLDVLEPPSPRPRTPRRGPAWFLDDAARQLRTPLAAIRASVEALLREADAGHATG